MVSSVDFASIDTHSYRGDAIQIARYVAAHEKLPALRSFDFHNAFTFATGQVPTSLRDFFSLATSATFSDLGRAIERRLNPKKWEPEPIIIDCRRPDPGTPQRIAKPKTEAAAPAAPADWRAAIRGE